MRLVDTVVIGAGQAGLAMSRCLRDRGVEHDLPELEYVIGLSFLRRRKSSFIDGVGDDASALAEHIVARRRGTRAVA
jgi:putative flavoprotein involved in K+ transport